MAIISDKKKFCFININRVGGGSIKSLLAKQANDTETTTPIISTIKSNIELHPHIKDYNKFSFVRCPYDWLVSIYYNIINHSQHPDYFYVKDLNFFDFIKWMCDVGMKREESDLQPFYRTQTDFVFINDELAVNKIFKYEAMCNDAGTSNIMHLFLQLKLEMPKNVPMLNKSQRPFGWQELYDNGIYKLVNRVFAEDFKNFNYRTYEC